jgi:Nuclease A inhibitor-like protein.
MSKKRKMRFSDGENSLLEKIRRASEGLFYISETDAGIEPFEGTKAEAVTKEEILRQTGNEPDAPVEERDFADFFARLTAEKDWYGEEEKLTAARFAELKKLLEENLNDLKVFKIGRIEIDIYAVGLDSESRLFGIRTKAVET